MNWHLAIAFLVLAGTALPARAGGPVGLGFDLRLGGYIQASGWASGCCSPGCGPCGYGGGGGAAPLAPWYLYWPMNAHFQVPAPMAYPYWPAPQAPLGAVAPVQQTGYYPTPPPYWYGQ